MPIAQPQSQRAEFSEPEAATAQQVDTIEADTLPEDAAPARRTRLTLFSGGGLAAGTPKILGPRACPEEIEQANEAAAAALDAMLVEGCGTSPANGEVTPGAAVAPFAFAAPAPVEAAEIPLVGRGLARPFCANYSTRGAARG